MPDAPTATPRRIEYMALDDVVPADRNPKRHAEGDLAASVERFGFTEPVLLDERTGKLVAGHGRLREALARQQGGGDPPEGMVVGGDGRWLLPVVRGWASADDAQAAAYLVASNRITEKGGWDQRGLAALLQELDGDLGGTGYSADDLNLLLASVKDPEPPSEFPTVDDDIKTEHNCPRCGYQWSGKA